MKIVHICLAGSYNDNWGYQDNIIPKYHKLAGNDVTVITSIFINSKNHAGYEKVLPNKYFLENGVKVIRLPFMKFPFEKVIEKLRLYKSLTDELAIEDPDFIFIHGLQFLDICNVVKYIKKTKKQIPIVVDNHADFSNSAKNWFSRNILHKVIWKYCFIKINPYTRRFYGVLPARVDFLIKMYGVPREKVDLLVLGADDEKVIKSKQLSIKEEIRKNAGVKSTDFLIITGGKIDQAKKQTLLLMQAIKNINREDVKLIVFGSVVDELKDDLERLTNGKNVQYIGWLDEDTSYKYFGAADLAVFPGRHSVFWEQVTGLGIPMLVKYWEGTTHVNVGGNCEFLYYDTVKEIEEKIMKIIDNPEKYTKMKNVAEIEGMKVFSYKSIAEQSINI